MNDNRYLYEEYDHILIISSWGLPSEYREAKYVFELEEISKEGDYKRTIVKDDENYYSSTGAIKGILSKLLSEKFINILIFNQDTILMNIIHDRWRYYKDKKEIMRKEIKEKILNQVLYSNETIINVINELGYNKNEFDIKVLKFVPGVFSYVNEGIIYSWRGERIYDIITGLVTLYTYDNLINSNVLYNGEVKKIAILLDTTHGINYLVTSMKEGVTMGAILYALYRISMVSPLEEFTVYHYNSDPIPKDNLYKPSLKLHLLSKKSIVKKSEFNLSGLTSLIEDQISIESLEGHKKRLSEFYSELEDEWDKIIESLILFSRGILIWALRIIFDLNKLPCIDRLKEIADNIKIRLEGDRDRKISYVKNGNMPTFHVVTYLILSKILKDIANNVKYENENNISAVLKDVTDCINVNEELKVDEVLRKLLNNLSNFREKFIPFDIDKLIKITNNIYLTPYKEINTHELENNLKNLLNEKSCLANRYECGGKDLYLKYGNSYYTVILEDNAFLIPAKTRIDEPRNFFAHAGLTYGLQWFGLKIDKNYVLCLGDYGEVVRLIRSSCS